MLCACSSFKLEWILVTLRVPTQASLRSAKSALIELSAATITPVLVPDLLGLRFVWAGVQGLKEFPLWIAD